MTKDEALKLALEALKQIDEAMPFPVAKLAQASIKEALAQPDPVKDLEDIDINITWNENSMRDFGKDELNFARAIEAKLKQKNGYAEEKNT